MYTDAIPMTDARGRWGRQSAFLSARRRILAVCVLVSLWVLPGGGQTRTAPAATPVQAAMRALNQGRFDQVETLLKGVSDPQAIVVRARADIARGRYAEADKALAPVASESPSSEAALELGLLQMRLGRRQEATKTLEGVLTRGRDPSTAADYLRLARAARALGQFQDANSYFRESAALAPDDVMMNTAWGEMFLEKYNKQDATKSVQAAVRADEERVPARVRLAPTGLDENPATARSLIERALKTNPSFVPAHLLLAELALDDAKRDDARATIQKALQINPASLEAPALSAAIDFLEGRTAEFRAAATEVLKINPLYGDVYRVAGAQPAQDHRDDESAGVTPRSLSVDRRQPPPRGRRGVHPARNR